MARLNMNPIFRSERFAAISLAVAAILGLMLANSGDGAAVISFFSSHISAPALQLDLSIAHWVTDGLLVIFFFIVAVELRHELTVGELNSFKHALAPGVAALGGVVVPALLYLFIAGTDLSRGWPIPTATDIAFALGLVALLGRGLPSRIRIFLLALAVLDDLIAIVIIAVFFSQSLDLLALGMAALAVYLFRYLGCQGRNLRPHVQTTLLILVGILAWYFTVLSGIHPTIAGVALGLVLNPRLSRKAAHALQPVTNALILPLFAFVSALVVIPKVSPLELSTAFWGISLALPLGKILGIMIAGSVMTLFGARGEGKDTLIRGWDLLTVSAVAGIGFTVSLLMNELAFAGLEVIRDEGVLGVLVGSTIAILIGGSLVSWRSRHYRKLR